MRVRGPIWGSPTFCRCNFPPPPQSGNWWRSAPPAPYQVKVAGGERLTRLAPADLAAAQRDLFAEPPGELLFENDAGAAGLRVSLESRKPSYTAEIEVEACLGNETLREDYLLRCTPSPSAHVDRVLVRFSHRRGAEVRWSLGKEDLQALAARRWPVEEQVAAGRPPEEETWELTLRRPRSEAFEIRATRETKLAGPEPVSLASLPDATQKPAKLVLRSVGAKSLQIINHRLKAVAIGPRPAGPMPNRSVPPTSTIPWPTPRRCPSRRCCCGRPSPRACRAPGFGRASCARTTCRTGPPSTWPPIACRTAAKRRSASAYPPGVSAATSTGCGSTACGRQPGPAQQTTKA